MVASKLVILTDNLSSIFVSYSVVETLVEDPTVSSSYSDMYTGTS